MSEELLTICCVTYQQFLHELPLFLHSLCLQTRKDFQVSIWHDGPSEKTQVVCEGFKKYLKLEYNSTGIRHNDYGYTLRQLGLDACKTKYINHQNGDNYLTPKFVEMFLGIAEELQLDFVYSNILHNYYNVNGDGQGPYNVLISHPCIYRIDISNFITKTDKAQAVGFYHRDHIADGRFVEQLQAKFPDLKMSKLNCVPLVHN